ncbi:hypothetical protein HDV02_002234 [Globomyces sp. JEL0801]|nr:hypothetical protein HDV02_002234 [Globomyces sp. JEL0801]
MKISLALLVSAVVADFSQARWESDSFAPVGSKMYYKGTTQIEFAVEKDGMVVRVVNSRQEPMNVGSKLPLIAVVDPDHLPQLHLTSSGAMDIVDDNLNLIKHLNDISGIGYGPQSGPFVATVDFDRRLRIRNAQKRILWDFPGPNQLESLDTDGMNFLATGDSLLSPNQKYFLTLERNGQLVSSNGFQFNPVSPGPVKPRVLILGKDGSLKLFDENERNIVLDNVYKGNGASNTEGNHFQVYITDEGMLTIYDETKGKSVWTLDLQNSWTPAYDFQYRSGCDFGGNDLQSVDVPSASDCANQCSNTLECSHFSFVKGRKDGCYLKKGFVHKSQATLGLHPDVMCGIRAIEWLEGALNSVWAFDCDFIGRDMGSVTTSGENCSSACKNNGCSHFAYVAKTEQCYFKTGAVKKTDAIVGRKHSGQLCGII